MHAKIEVPRHRAGVALAACAAAALVLSAGLAVGQEGAAGGDGEQPVAPAPAPVEARPQPGAQPQAQPPGGDEEITLPSAPEPLQLRALLEYAVQTLGINMAVDDAMQGTVSLNAPIQIKKSQLLDVLNALLEQRGFAIIENRRINFYEVRPTANLPVALEGPLATTRIIETPNVKPSSLQGAVATQLGAGGGLGGGAGGGLRVSYLDNLAVILVTGTPGQAQAFEDIVKKIIEKRGEQELIRIDLTHISSPAALTRLLELVGEKKQQQGQPGGFEPQFDPNQQAGGGAGILGSLENLSNRLVVSPQGNALIFRGSRAEADRVRELIDVIDQKNELSSRKYFTGSATGQIAQLASERGLGAITKFEQDQNQFGGGFPAFDQQGRPIVPEPALGGSRLVADEKGGYIVYYGTESQQEQMAALVEEFKAEGEIPVVRVYLLRHQDAEKMAELINGLITGSQQTGESPLLPTGTGRFGAFLEQPFEQQPGLAPTEGAFTAGQNVSVIADIPNNQLVVRAPAKQQDEFASLIEKLDLRRPQVFIQARIVLVSDRDDFRLAFENQILHLADNSFGAQSRFGDPQLTVPGGTGDRFLQPRVVNPTLAGFTAALILNDYVPIVMTALQTDSNTRILASPQVLVNNNEEAEIVALNEEPTTTTTQTAGNPIQGGFGGYEEAGTTLTVTPGISEGGYIRLKYNIELSNFEESRNPDLPPPRLRNTVTSESVTVPDGMTIVVGGIVVDSSRKSVIKIPLIGDIPLVGHLFRDTQKTRSNQRLYVFITPRIMRDPNFLDLSLLTEGPQAEAGIDPDIPPMKPIRIELLDAASGLPSKPSGGDTPPPTDNGG